MPMTFDISRQWVFGSWDRTRLIKPFARMRPTFHAAIDAHAWTADDETLTRELERVLQLKPDSTEISL